ncbi:MAG: type II toxin-antitoxin system RatA family toxin [Gammaproteobacteria bacterium]|nr:type II toxin-antitoxin system RatA family toxin [Gammaproteobacteria bacterium]
MAVIQRRARVAYRARQMLELVNDIDAYPDFLHWCSGARIEKVEGATVEAALDVGIRGIHKTIRTRNVTTLPAEGSARIDIEMLDGPLKHLHGHWLFSDSGDGGCDVELSLDYETHRTPFGALLRALFDEIANSQLNAFIRRADAIYGGA